MTPAAVLQSMNASAAELAYDALWRAN